MIALLIPSWIWVAACLALLVGPLLWDCRRITRKRDNFRAVEQERLARSLTAPLGHVDRVYDREDAA